MNQDRIKHLEFIQAIITRMNSNSFQIKGWMITLTSALLAVYASTSKELFVLICLFPVIIFWFLDSYYITQERKFRGLYNDIAEITNTQADLKPFEINPSFYTEGDYRFFKAFTSRTLLSLYLPLLLLLIISFCYLSSCR